MAFLNAGIDGEALISIGSIKEKYADLNMET